MILDFFSRMYVKLLGSAVVVSSSFRIAPVFFPSFSFSNAILAAALFCFYSDIGQLMERRGR